MQSTFSTIIIIFGLLTYMQSAHTAISIPIPERPIQDIAKNALATAVKTKNLWKNLEANSEQRQPIYIGNSVVDLVLGQSKNLPPQVGFNLKNYFERAAVIILQKLQISSAIFEAWPVQNDYGQHTWAIARYRTGIDKPWQWLDASDFKKEFEKMDPKPVLPLAIDLRDEKNFSDVFNDFLEMDDLYAKPLFSDIIFTTNEDTQVLAAWLPTAEREAQRDYFLKNRRNLEKIHARRLSQPARYNDDPISFAILANQNSFAWPEQIAWVEPVAISKSEALANIKKSSLEFPPDLLNRYKRDVEILSGVIDADFPISHKKRNFSSRKNNAEVDNQLADLTDYLKERYQVIKEQNPALGLKIFEQKFMWRGMEHSNLFVVIPGTLPAAEDRPVIIADHFDTALAEDIYKKNKQRVSVPGADDNVSAVAGVLQAVEFFSRQKVQAKNSIIALHLTGEEYPADDLGARRWVTYMLQKQWKISGIILMDMIGYNEHDRPIFQISAGASKESLRIARIAEYMARHVAPNRNPAVRERFNEFSYLFNTDGIIFSDVGYPVILFNEHLNRHRNLFRHHYHEATDTADRINYNYAIDIVKTMIGTVEQLSY